MVDLIYNLKTIQQQIALAERTSQRPSGCVSLLAVSKGQSLEAINTLAQAGQSHFGENYLQEALSKIISLSLNNIVWHFIGHLQMNKIRLIAQHFSWVHTLSRLKEAQQLSAARSANQVPLNICIQVRLDTASHKAGVLPAEVLAFAQSLQGLPHLRLRGLMGLPPYNIGFPEQAQYFSLVEGLFQSLNQQGIKVDTLSMGTTHDMTAAIAHSATWVRIGRGLFGPRKD